MTRFIAAIVTMAATSAGGCAVGQQIEYNQMPRLRTPGSGTVALAVQDGRDEVWSGAKPPNFCGVLRGGYGNPFSVTTASNRPLAADFATVIARALGTSGFQVTIVPTTPGQGDAVTMRAFAAKRADRSLLVQIDHWKSDTYKSTLLTYRVTAQVRDGQGQVLARTQIAGHDDLGGNFFDPGDHMKKVVPAATRRQLERLLNDPAITKALQGGGADAPPPDAPPAPASSPADAPPSGSPAPTVTPRVDTESPVR